MGSGLKAHWETIYTSKADAELSWYQQQSTVSYQLITEFAKPGSSVIDIGGGSSSLAGQLVIAGFRPVTVLDISKAALARAQNRIALRSRQKSIGGLATSSPVLNCLPVTYGTTAPSFISWSNPAIRLVMSRSPRIRSSSTAF
jgi:hypothetical protein